MATISPSFVLVCSLSNKDIFLHVWNNCCNTALVWQKNFLLVCNRNDKLRIPYIPSSCCGKCGSSSSRCNNSNMNSRNNCINKIIRKDWVGNSINGNRLEPQTTTSKCLGCGWGLLCECVVEEHILARYQHMRMNQDHRRRTRRRSHGRRGWFAHIAFYQRLHLQLQEGLILWQICYFL